MFRDEILGEIKETIIKMINKDSSKEYRKIYQNEYRIKNKVKIYKARKMWVQKNKEIIRCGCGGKYDNHLNEKKKRHFNCEKHLKYMNRINQSNDIG